MLQAQNTQAKRTRALPGVVALIFSAFLVAGAVVGGTHAYLMSKTDTYVNTFVSGLPAAGELTVEGAKTLEGRSLVEGEFAFELYETDADFEVAEDADPLQAVANGADGAFSFSPIEYTQAGDYYYVVTEKAPGQGEQGFVEHVAYDKTQYRITVKVTESNGAYVVDSEIVSYDPEAAVASLDPQAGSAPADSGVTAGSGQGAGAGTDGVADGEAGEGDEDTSTGADGVADGEAGEGSGGPATGAGESTALAGFEGDAPEGTAASSPAPIAGGQAGREYAGTEVAAIVFKNKFDSPDPTVVVNGAVSLDGRDMKVGEFFFELYEAEGTDFEVKPDADPAQRVGNAGAGAQSGFGFAALTFSKPGTYRYVISQDASEPLGGVTYDDEVYRLEVEVKADASGVLSAVAKMFVQGEGGEWVEVAVLQPNEQGELENPDGKPYVAEDPRNADCAVAYVTFANTYEAEPVSHAFAGDVDLDGRDMAEGEFAFTLEPVTEGAPVPDASRDANDADGGFGFGSVEFTEPGVYEYLIKQDASAALEGVTYDNSVHRVIVTVTDDGNGKLVKEVVVLRDGVEVADGSGVKYLNKYEQPITPPGPGGGDGDDPELPDSGGTDDGGSVIPGVPGQGGTDLEQTGDATMALFGAFALVAVCAVVVGAVAFAKMRRWS